MPMSFYLNATLSSAAKRVEEEPEHLLLLKYHIKHHAFIHLANSSPLCLKHACKAKKL